MNIPNWWAFALIAAAAWRIYQLVGHDEILDRPRRWLLRMGDAYQDERKEWKDIPADYRLKWGIFITCPYCAGFWIAVLWWIAWLIFPHATTVVAVPFALSAALIGLSKILSQEDE